MESRAVLVDGMHNVRDLGGVPVDGGQTAYGVVYRGETVAHLTPDGAGRLRELGVGRVLDLREPDEASLDGDGPLAAAYAARDMAVERVPLVGGDIAADPVGRVATGSSTADGYAHYLHNGGADLAGALARAAWAPTALYVHCAVGKDRTGVVAALLLKAAGASDDAVVADHLLTAPAVAPVLRRLATRPAYEHLVAPDWDAQRPSEEAMRLFLVHLRRLGGALSWLLDQGVAPETADRLIGLLRGELARAVDVPSAS
jgi:hypothetical protein